MQVYNYSSGPSALPTEVLEKIHRELFDFRNTGMSVMEISHRSDFCMDLFEEAQQRLKKLTQLGDDYTVLFMQGGALMQFSAVPLNLFTGSRKAAFVHTGNWTKGAMKEARKTGKAIIKLSGEDSGFKRIPDLSHFQLDGDEDYAYICTNNTIEGTRIAPERIPETKSIPLVADMSSNILSENYNMQAFDLAFAGAQKNLGIAGVCVVLIRNNLLERSPDNIPDMLNYRIMKEKESMLNTPPVFAVYVLNLVLEWIEANGGVAAMEQSNLAKAKMLYDYIDNSASFSNDIQVADRSLMNIIFTLPTEEANKEFASYAQDRGLMFLKGHRNVGGLRASMYNAAPMAQVETLIQVMQQYEKERQ